MNNNPAITVDYLEAGSSGPVVMLVHSSVSGARQWRRLMGDLRDQFRVRAVNLFGYGKTSAMADQIFSRLTIKQVSSKPRCRQIPTVLSRRPLVRRFSCHEDCGRD